MAGGTEVQNSIISDMLPAGQRGEQPKKKGVQKAGVDSWVSVVGG